MNSWKTYWKAIAAFASTVVVPGVVQWVQSGQPWPHDTAGWVLWVATILGVTGAVAGSPPNALTKNKHEAPEA